MENKNKIGTTLVSDHPNSEVAYRITYPSDRSGDEEEFYYNYPSALSRFEQLIELIGDVHLYMVLLQEDGDAIDEELIMSFFEDDED